MKNNVLMEDVLRDFYFELYRYFVRTYSEISLGIQDCPLPSTSSQSNAPNELREHNGCSFGSKICWLPGLPDPSHHHVLSNLKNDNSEEEPMGFEEFFQELSRELTRTPFNPSTEKGAEFEGKERSPPPGAVKRVLESVSDSQLKESDPFESLIPSVVGFVFNLETIKNLFDHLLDDMRDIALRGPRLTEPVAFGLLQKESTGNEGHVYERWGETIKLSVMDSMRLNDAPRTPHTLSEKVELEWKLIGIISKFFMRKIMSMPDLAVSSPLRLLVEASVWGRSKSKWMFYINIGAPGEPHDLEAPADWLAVHVCRDVRTLVPYKATIYGFYAFG